MNREEVFRSFRAVADALHADYAETLEPPAFRQLMTRLQSGLDDKFQYTKSIDNSDVLKKREEFRMSLELHLQRLRERGETFDEKGVQSWLAGLCPGFWPFC